MADVYTAGSVPDVSPNKRGDGQIQRSFWLPREEWEAAVKAAEELETKPSVRIRAALREMVEEADALSAERKRAEQEDDRG
jgi:hypothetical protein